MAHERSVKRTRQFITDVCREYQLEDGTLDRFTEVCVYFLVSIC